MWVCVAAADPRPDPAPDGGELILLTLDPRPDLPGKDRAVMELRTGALHGELSLVGHDLRDHLRRHALPCGDQDTFRGLPSSPFARLTAAVPLSD